tara:strand:+ start:309 stop:542 length:234 start_codon:yes stop_codon:yes gene_type:complete
MSAPYRLKSFELTRILAGPWIGQTLAIFGAKVIRVIRTTASGTFPLSTMKTINQQPIFIVPNLGKTVSPSILKMLLI